MTQHEQYRDDLPLYAVGALTAAEAEEIKRHLAECSECRDELVGLHEAVAQTALAVQPAEPRAGLRGELLARLGTQPAAAAPAYRAEPGLAQSGSAPAHRAEPALAPARRGEASPVLQLKPRSRWFWAPAFAAAVLAIGFVGLWRRDQRILDQNRELIGQLQSNNLTLQRARELIDTLTAADAQRAVLVATGSKPQPEAKTVYSPKQHNLVLLASNLMPLAPNKVYELWLLPASGAAPVPAGTFTPDSGGGATLVLPQFGEGATAKAFAVTVENAPGSSTPTMPIVLLGTT